MALTLRINAIFGDGELVVYDTTGSINAGYNTGGYIDVNDFASAELRITPPGETTYISLTSVYPTFPNIEGTGYLIVPDDLGLTEFEAGIWTIKLIVTDNSGVDTEVECKFKNDCAIRSCITDRIKQITPNEYKAYDAETFRLKMLLEASDAAMCDGDYDRVNDLIQELTRKCDCNC